MAPLLSELVLVQGDPQAGKFVECVTFKGLTFQHEQRLLPPTGYAPFQAAFAVDAAIMLDGARNVVIPGL